MEFAEKFGKTLGIIRKERKLTIEEMAETCEVSIKFYSNLEKGKHNPRFDVVLRIGEEFDISLDDIIGRSEYAQQVTSIDRSRTLGQTLSHVRSELRLSQVQMAGCCGLSIDAYRDIENGDKIPRFNTIAYIAAEFDISLDALKKGASYASV